MYHFFLLRTYKIKNSQRKEKGTRERTIYTVLLREVLALQLSQGFMLCVRKNRKVQEKRGKVR